MVESMARGTPVVAYARGSVPDLVDDGVTGFIVNSSDSDVRGAYCVKKTGREELCEALERIAAMKESDYARMRSACRERVERLFTRARMLDEYEALFARLLRAHRST